ncbi:ArnT family glycosyltransferase [Thermodesulfovibrio yellowstonii]|uniref:Dolichyl-phosphate-mannose-protein mannosyltransferase family protein n=1 Tax=Thermodesulfovibrio yellowstonii (strain ATCC 51303 / DSM 11347 / YP87) TaxID=289376 RepID=B5YHM0_THEYD|nr:glycosyltransferase family 39 protein [Thermodesulfovibrio yellowstonii]ACI21667.1 dolichyl-phosphate-mannose-protein mannosyltransferase family protein [Thermodesulfovibrio yellowstonii DSM 11347]MDI6865672.1 glycosyltransferase family 39 protein [Thermodesulfovibrio yellowstonii]
MIRNLIILIALFIALFRLGSVTLFDVDEAVFAEATKEMLQSGNWITPTYNDEPRYDKPILFYWLMSLSYKIFGINEFSARFPSALAGFILCLSIFIFLNILNRKREAIYVVLCFAFSLYYLVYTHAAVTDMALALFISLSLFSFYLAIYKNQKYIYGFYIFSALAFLTKGLIGIVFPFSIAGIYIIFMEGINGIKRIFNFKAFIVFLLISLPWYVTQIAINGQDFIQQFFIKHHFMRYTGVISGHKGPFYYFIPVLIIGLFPWISFLSQGLRNIRKDNLRFFSLIWFSFILIFFSFSTTKLPNYILPAIPAVSIIISHGMAEFREKPSSVPLIIIGFLSILFAAAFLIGVNKIRLYLPDFDITWLYVITIVMLLFAVVSFYGILKRKNIFLSMACLTFVFLMIISLKIIPYVNKTLQESLYRCSLYVKENLKDRIVFTYKINKPSIVFYSDRKIPKIDSEEELLNRIQKNDKIMIITSVKDLSFLKDRGLKILWEGEGYAVLEKL